MSLREWRGPEYPGEFPTLGYHVAELIQATCVIPDGDRMGQPFMLTDEMLRCLVNHYRLDPKTGKFVYFRGTQFTRSQKYGKGPFSAALICAEGHPDGPVLFDGWDANGEPVGRPWATPHIQVTAVSEDQTDNVFRALLPMIQMGPLVDVFHDVGLTRINLPRGGMIEPVTASAVSRLGQRITLAVQDQPESWLASNGGHKLADNQRRGLAGMGGRFFATPNAWDPVENSVAQRTGESKAPGVYLDDVDPGPGSVRNKADRRRMLKKVYGDSATKPRKDAEWEPWVDLDRIDGEIEALIEYDPAQAERWFLNRKLAGEAAAFDFKAFLACEKPGYMPPAGAAIVLGVDGARYDDAVAVVGTEVKTGFQWVVKVIERPVDAGDDYAHDLDELDGAVVEVGERYKIWRIYCDPHWLDAVLEKWQNRYGPKVVLAWYTNRPREIAWAVRNYLIAVAAGELSWDGSDAFRRHVQNSRKRMFDNVRDDKERPMFTLAKPSHRSPLKIDLAMAAVLSWKARRDVIAAGGAWFSDQPEPEPEPASARWTPGVALPTSVLSPSEPVGPMGSMS